MSQFFIFPPGFSSATPASNVGPNGDPAPLDSALVAGINPSGDLAPLETDASGNLLVNIANISGDLATETKQDTQITLATAGNASLSSIDTKLTSPLAVTGPLTDTQLRASAVNITATNLDIRDLAFATDSVDVSGSIVDIASLPAGLATSALQTAGNASLSSIDTKLTSPLAVTGPLTDTQLRATPVPVSLSSSPLPTGAATEAKQDDQIALETTMDASLSSIDTKLTDNSQKTQIVDSAGQSVDTKALGTAIVAADVGLITNSVIHGVTTGGGGGYVDVKVTPSGAMVTETTITGTVPLPTGAATAANQATEIASLASIDSKLTSPLAITAASLPLPTGAATSALQTAGNASLSSIDTKLTSPLTTNARQTGTFTDRSGTTSGTPSTSTTVASSNSSRKYFIIQNVSTTATIWINFTSAATTTQPSIQLPPSGSFVMEAGFVSTEAITVISTVASVPFTAKEA